MGKQMTFWASILGVVNHKLVIYQGEKHSRKRDSNKLFRLRRVELVECYQRNHQREMDGDKSRGQKQSFTSPGSLLASRDANLYHKNQVGSLLFLLSLSFHLQNTSMSPRFRCGSEHRSETKLSQSRPMSKSRSWSRSKSRSKSRFKSRLSQSRSKSRLRQSKPKSRSKSRSKSSLSQSRP